MKKNSTKMNKFTSKYFNTATLMDEALIELLNQKDIEYITVKEICSKAGVNRSTFYLHYEGIYDLVDETIEYIDKKFSSYFDDLRVDIENSPKESLLFIQDKYLLPYLNFIKDNKSIFRASINNPRSMQAHNKYRQLKENILIPVLKRFKIEDKRHKYILSFYIQGIIGIINEWLIDDCQEDVGVIKDIIINCINLNESNYKVFKDR